MIRAVGVSENIIVDVCSEPLDMKKGDIVLLCSDGLTNMVNDNTIEYVLLQNKHVEEKVLKLVDLAIEEGGYDNVSVQIIDFCNIDDEQPVKSKNNILSNKIEKVFPFLKKYPKTTYVIYCLIAIICIYAVYDMFFKKSKTPVYQSNQVQLINPDSTNSVTDRRNIDTASNKKKRNQENIDNSDLIYLTYTVKKGDALSLISQQYNVKVKKLMELNKLDNLSLN